MDAKSDYLENALLDHVLKAVTFTSPTNIYIALFTVAPADDGTGGTEVSGNNYARTLVTFDAASGGTSANSGIVTFPQATGGAWGTVVAMGLYDMAAAGNLLYHGNLAVAKVVGDGDTISFPMGALTVSET